MSDVVLQSEASLPAKVTKPRVSSPSTSRSSRQRAMQLYRSGVMGALDDLPEDVRDLILALDALART